MADQRPLGREKNVTGPGKGIKRRGEGLGTGPVGSSDGYSGRTGGGSSSGPRRSGGGGGLGIIGLLLVLLLGGGGGLFSILGGGGSDTQVQTQTPSQYSSGQSSTGTYNNIPGGTNSYGSGGAGSIGNGAPAGGSASSGGAAYSTGSYGGFDLSQLSQLFGAGSAQSMTGTQTGWGSAANTGTLDTTVAAGSRAKYTQILGNSQDKMTILVYLCGADLESKSGMATNDLTEMTRATLSDNVNVVIYTGGAQSWKNNAVSNQVNQVYLLKQGGLQRLIESDGNKAMTDPQTLANFVAWGAQQFPANRYGLIFWDHGSGSLQGYGYDEKHARNGSMSLSGIDQALHAANVKFDFVGFDTCLMATAETGLMLSKYADYMIASEETEPGTGWYYTNWLTELCANPSMPTTQIGKRIIDDFVEVSAQKARGQSTTLSIVDLAELSHTLPTKLVEFSKSTSSMLENSDYKTVSQARSSTREFARSSRIDQIDLAHFAMNLGTPEGKTLADTVKSAVKYNRTSANMTNCYGLSIYFPQQKLSYVDRMVQTYKAIGLDDSYSRTIKQFASVSAAGQSYGSGAYSSSGSPFPMLSGSSSYSDGGATEELLTQLLSSMLSGSLTGVSGLTSSNSGFLSDRSIPEGIIVSTLENNHFDAEQLVWSTQDDGTHTMHIAQDQWDLINRLDLNVFYDDGEGYVDMGLDNVYSFTENGDLIGETDRTWIAINDQPVAYYHLNTTQEEDGTYTITGRVPAMLNDERVDLLLVFDSENPYGYVAGALYDYTEGETETIAKALIPEEDADGRGKSFLKDGDQLDFICDFYSYDGGYEDSYLLGERMTISGEPVISNVLIDDGNLKVTYCFTDIYGSTYWTPSLEQ